MSAHKYSVQLIRRKQNLETLHFEDLIELEKTVSTFAEAVERAVLFGARPRRYGSELPKIENTRAVYPCKDKRFARVQIVIVS